MDLPKQFEDRMKTMLGSEYEEFIKSYEEEKKVGLRVNPIKMSAEAFVKAVKFEMKSVPWCETGFVLSDSSVKAGREALHDAGAYYMQEPSAMSVVSSLPLQKGMKVLDLCAAPGGKSTQIAGILQNEGLLVSNEINPTRARILSSNIERMGITNCVVTNESPDRLEDIFEEYFDAVVVDAPCSGEGMFRKDDTAIEEWSPENVEMCAERQKIILESAHRMLKPGGFMAYSTCTFSVDEDEENVAWFLKEHENYIVCENRNSQFFSPARTDLINGDYSDRIKEEVAKAVRLWPHRIKGEGHFVCILKKEGILNENEGRKFVPKRVGKQNLTEITNFFKENLVDFTLNTEYIIQFNDRIIISPSEMTKDLSRLHVVRTGVDLGEIKKDRFEPSHSFAMSLLPSQVKRSAELNEEDALKYRHGEEIRGDFQNGWALVCVNGVSLGWGKAVGGVLKNHYPKGLRIKY